MDKQRPRWWHSEEEEERAQEGGWERERGGREREASSLKLPSTCLTTRGRRQVSVYTRFPVPSMTLKGSNMACSSLLPWRRCQLYEAREGVRRAGSPLQVVESNALSPDAEPPLAREIDELADHDKLWRAMLSLSSSYVKLAKVIEESAASAVIGSGLPSNSNTSSRDCCWEGQRHRGVSWRRTLRVREVEITFVEEGYNVACVIVLPEPFPLRDSQRNVRACGRLAC